MPKARAMPASRGSNLGKFTCGSPVPKTESGSQDSPSIDVPRLFGTDGIRGTAGTYPLDPPTVRRVGAALVRALPRGGGPRGAESNGSPRLLIGRDTRESGQWIEAELAHGAGG